MTSAPDQEIVSRYFAKPGPGNTNHVLETVARRAAESNVETVLVPSGSGESAFKALDVLGGRTGLIAVTYATGLTKPDHQDMEELTRRDLEAKGVRVLTCQHAFGGVGRAVRKKLGTYQVDEIMAYTLRVFGHGTKVAIEIALMAADAGLIRTDRDVISMGGTNRGLDTALVIKPANSADFFHLKVREVICKPAFF